MIFNTKEAEQNRLLEVDFMRATIIIFLVIMHAFTMYSGENLSWPLPKAYEPILTYQWIQKITYAFLLEGFTFLSGYVYSYSYKKNMNLKKLLLTKAKRLLLPSLLFSMVYSFLFYEKAILSFRYLYDILSGMGHLWYLVMLFWCFVFSYPIVRRRLNSTITFLFLFIVSVLSSIGPNYFQIGQSLYFLLFFMIGFYLEQNRHKYQGLLASGVLSKQGYKISIFLFSIIIILLLLALSNKTFSENIYIDILIKRLLRIAYSTLGIVIMVYLSWSVVKSKKYISPTILRLSAMSFGIYIFQEFLLKIIYYKSSLTLIINMYAMPIISSIVVLVFSYYLTFAFRKTIVGKYLIG